MTIHRVVLRGVDPVTVTTQAGDTIIIERGYIGTNAGMVYIDEIHQPGRLATAKPTPNRGPYASHEPWKKRK